MFLVLWIEQGIRGVSPHRKKGKKYPLTTKPVLRTVLIVRQTHSEPFEFRDFELLPTNCCFIRMGWILCVGPSCENTFL